MSKSTTLALILLAAALPTFVPAADTRSGSQYVGGDVPGEPAKSSGSTGAMATDVDGDGCYSKSEVKPDSGLAKRFDARDLNHDGKLCKDEYFVK
jgi:hypothetical protein